MSAETREISSQDVKKVVDRYADQRAIREPRAASFFNGTRPYLIFQAPPNDWRSRTPEQSFIENFNNISAALDVPSDHLPVMEPWFGTGVYANMYGCPYVWRENEAPAVHYKYHSVDEIRNITKPRWQDSEIARLVLDAIRYFKSKTGDAIPIALTDTQSASDTATLVLDASEVFAGCLLEPEAIMRFMRTINELVIEFSSVQMELIGDALAMPGHIMLNNKGFKGISISDDNLAVASPKVNASFNLPLDEAIGHALGGIAIHSCGPWARSMPMLKDKSSTCVAIDCAIDNSCDPNPNAPEAVRDALAGLGIHAHVRLTCVTDKMLETVKRVLHPDLKLIVHPAFIDLPTAERNYEALDSLLSEFYGSNIKK